jgi:hypothetical protein
MIPRTTNTCADHLRDVSPRRNEFFQKDQGADGCHPAQMHHAHNEENHHESPAAEEAVHAMRGPHTERAQVPVMPVLCNEVQRILTMLQAGAF